MSDTAELLKQAGALGEALARHARVAEFIAAEAAIEADPEAQRLLQTYTRHVEHLRTLERAQRPIEVADKRKLAELEHELSARDTLKRLMRSQADYLEIVRQVHAALHAPIERLHAGRSSTST